MTKLICFPFEHHVKLYKQLNSVDSFTHSYIYMNLYMLPFKTFSAAVYSCLVNAFKFITFLITTSLNLQQKCALR